MQSQKPRQATSDVAFCIGCGRQTRATSKYCPTCGTPLLTESSNGPRPRRLAQRSNTPSPLGRNVSTATAPLSYEPGFNLVAALIFPFRERRWLAKMWMLPLLAVVPIFSVVLLRGWRLEIARRMGRGFSTSLPSWNYLGVFFFNGLILWFMTALYAIPQVILLAIFALSKRGALIAIGLWIYETFVRHSETSSVTSLFAEIGSGILASLAIPVIVGLLMYPFYRVGMLRFALTGRIGGFFALRANWRFIRNHVHSLAALYFYEFIVNALFGFLCGVFALTGVGLLLIPMLLFPFTYWMTGHLFGTVARQVHNDIQRSTRFARRYSS